MELAFFVSDFVKTFFKHPIVVKTKLIPIAFTFLYVLAMLRPVMPVFDYVINHDYIVEYLCINQDKPEMNCDGKCYLMQMLEEKDQQKKQNLPPIDLREYPIGFVEFLQLAVTVKLPFTTKTNTNYSDQYRYLLSHSLFHPPIFS